MADEVQEIVDRLGDELGRAVAVDNDRMELRAYNPQSGPVDEVRRNSIMRRAGNPDVVAYLNQFNIRQARQAVHIPANPELGMIPRTCVTVWHKQERLGYLWLVNPEPGLSDAQIARAQEAAADIAMIVSEERWLDGRHRGRERVLVRDLLATDPALRARAASELVQTAMVDTAGGAQSLVVHLIGEETDLNESTRRRLDAALRDVRRTLPSRTALHLAYPDHGLLILVGRSPDDACAGLGDRLLDAATNGGGRAVVGVGMVHQTLSAAHASYDQAMTATLVAEAVEPVGPVARWAELGVYRVLAQLPAQELTADAVDPRLLALFTADRDGVLTPTLETFLECGGNTRRIVERLVLHRTSLYYRLDKIAEITGVDLADGDDRLAMHLALKIARLAGVHPMCTTSTRHPQGAPATGRA